ncbi:hypothetical protein HII31_02481 [Pseudocercospora fuligena]|uniref:Uncharacterized protein n=1 Tax=Pseudocercospora fuligena TaxID=685502 RepID=A0A8H6RQF8_9PEZI|nr:hypothetical protein HII31_02481 [Pseudocercospora fuligena]
MATNDTTHSNSQMDYYEFQIEWKVAERLPEVRRPWTEMDKITLDQNTTTRQLRLDIKDRIQRYFEDCEDFGGNDILRFMRKITENYNGRKPRSKRAGESTFWIIRFHVTIIAGQRIFQLDSGIWQRVANLSDIINPTDDLKMHVNLYAKGCSSKQRGKRFWKDTDLSHHIYPRLQEVTYYKVGTVQNPEARSDKVDLVEAEDKATPLERKNVILARYEEIDEDEMCQQHLILSNSWRIVTPDGTGYFGRIGDPEGGIKCNTVWLSRHNIYVTLTYQKDGNPSMAVLKGKIEDEKHNNRYNEQDQEIRRKEVPVLPPITLRLFPKAFLNDTTNQLRDGIWFKVIVRVVYLLPNLKLDESELRRPQNACFRSDNGYTFWNLEETIFDRSEWNLKENQIPTAVRRADCKCVWWIMNPWKKGDIGKMYWVDDVNRPVCKYIPDAASEDGNNCVLYTECHVRPKTAPDEYNERGM